MFRSWFLIAFVLLIVPEETLQVSADYRVITTTRDCFLDSERVPNCNGLQYQSLNGSCNNPLNPLYGKSWTPFKRLLPPSYGNQLNSTRLSVSGGPLPLSRVISNYFNDAKLPDRNSSRDNAMFVQFAQYITHDLTGATTVNEENGVPVNCSCKNPSPSCLIIQIPPNDPYYEEGECTARKGSQMATRCDHLTNVSLPAEQINRLSAFVDAETIYGWSEDLLEDLRNTEADDGTLRLVDSHRYSTSSKTPMEENIASDPAPSGCPMHRNQNQLLSLSDLKPYLAKRFDCPAHIESPICFASGDDRVNENIGLVSTHLIFTREHNRIARRLKALNSMWDGDTIFEETRRIIIAIHQTITYNEFLPLLLGPELMKDFDLETVKNGFYYGYDAAYDSTISNSFATAAFRYGHSQIGTLYRRLQSDYVHEEAPTIPVFEGLFFQEAVINGSTPSIMRGLMVDPARVVDLRFVEDVRDRMFESATKPGQDLLAINIERGREHGLPSYNEFRDFCGLQRISSWTDLQRYMPLNVVEKLQNVYESFDDIDLYVGSIAENPVSGGSVGPTFGCIIGYQFRDIRKGDRYWFENPSQFSLEQLQELRKVTFSSILCNNMDGMETISPRAMELEGEDNGRIPCSDVPQINLESWKINNHKQGGVWTRWFLMSQKTSVDITLQKIMYQDSESVCSDPLHYEVREINANNGARKIRFKCPKGSITVTGYPNVKESFNYHWTQWYDRDSPSSSNGQSDEENLQFLKSELPGMICDTPLYMQAKTKDGFSAFESSEVFTHLHPKYGLVCYGANQTNGRCRDYRVRFYCPKKDLKGMPSKAAYIEAYLPDAWWTQWINVGNPQGGHDLETLRSARSRGYMICDHPLLIEAREAGTNISSTKTGDVFTRFNIYHGLICYNRDQTNGRCHDYEARYLCSNSTTKLSELYG